LVKDRPHVENTERDFMAFSDSFDTSLTTLRRLFTAAERKILDASTTRGLAAAGEAQVKQVLKQARILRDKWRGLLDAQSRSTKRARKPAGLTASATAPVNVRSRQKADLLTQAVVRLEKRLAGIAGARQPVAASTAPRRSPRRGAKKAVKVPAAAARPAVATITAPKPRSISKKARQAGTRKSLEDVGVQGFNTSAAKQRSAGAMLKAERLRLKGITTRRAGHTQARGGRAQARRDQRHAGR
jgi:hypothetical protein